jgi:hypothetical protein
MISAQTLRVCREGKPVSTFPDHALESPNNLAMTSQNPIETEACALPLAGLGV